jgi:oligopeptide/dipeptide ABC transporter, ATP-binding protein, C-terminal domain
MIKDNVKIAVEDLVVHFTTNAGMVQAVRGISFDLHEGETLAIVGESGSGKSVTSRAIIGILSPNARVLGGSITYEGNNLLEFTEEDYAGIRGNKISMIFQDPMSSLNPIMRIGQQITEAMVVKLKISKEEAKQRAIKIMEEVGIGEAENRYYQYPFQFSGGMRQRIVIAIALVTEPEILICDEPTTALDVTIQAQILDLINDLKVTKNLSVIFITHDLGVVANMADRVAVMYAGKIVEIGTAREIFYDPRHPYTWALLSSMPDLDSKEKLFAIPGTPPDMLYPPKGDAFADRNSFAMKIDFEQEPPFFKISDTHYAATWLEHPDVPDVELPPILKARLKGKQLT